MDPKKSASPKLKIPLDPGRHQLKLVTRRGDTRTRVVEVQPGREAKVTVVFADLVV